MLRRLRDIVRDHNPARQLFVAIGNAWYALGPALVFALGGVNGFQWEDWPLAFLLVLPLAALLRIFARERSARIEQAIELSAAYRGTAFLLGEVIVHDDAYRVSTGTA